MCMTKYGSDYAVSIIEIRSGLFVAEAENGDMRLDSGEHRLIFYDEADAESILLRLSEETDGCYALVDEAMDMGFSMDL